MTTLCAVAMLTIGHNAAKAQARREPSLTNKIVLFGAHWCAPCRGEYRILPTLIAAAAPSRLILAWVDRSISSPFADLPGSIEVLDVEAAQSLAGRIGGEGYGLPFSAIFDSAGHLCGIWRKPLRSEDISELKAICRR